MTDSNKHLASEPFISVELRPRIVPQLETRAPISPNASVGDVKACALDVMHVSEADWLRLYPDMGNGVTWEQSYTRNSDVTWNTLDSETVLLNVTTSRYYTLNRIATAIWELFEADRSLGDIVDSVCESYDVGRSQIERDLLVLARQLHFEDLLRIGD